LGGSVNNPLRYYENNVAQSLAMLASLRAEGISRIVFSSTCATYGVPSALPITEEMQQQPINPYGASKLMIERALADIGRANGLSWVTLRYFNAAGCDPEGEIGEDHEPEPHLIPRCLMAAAGEIDRFEIFGTDYPTPDGTAVRDFVHVCDLAFAHVAALRRVLAGGESMALNLGSDHGYSVREVVDAVERVTGRKIPVREGPRRPGDPPALVASSALAERMLGFVRRPMGLDEMIASAWAWRQRRRPLQPREISAS
jgi:UDP-arabinose 4-epimerase